MALSLEEREAPELVRRGSVLLAGGYAWATTVLHPVLQRGAGAFARSSAAFAAVALLAFALVPLRTVRMARSLALYGFLVFSVGTWILLGTRLAVERLEPTRAALGSLGWMLFAFGWGVPREPARVPEDDPGVLPGAPLAPKGELPRGASAVLALSVACALLPLVTAWRITRPYQSLLGHAVGIVTAVFVVSIGADIAVRRGKWAPVEPLGRRLSGASAPLSLLALALFIGAIILLTR